jgi:hypothetical protein
MILLICCFSPQDLVQDRGASLRDHPVPRHALMQRHYRLFLLEYTCKYLRTDYEVQSMYSHARTASNDEEPQISQFASFWSHILRDWQASSNVFHKLAREVEMTYQAGQ